ncbi:nucleotidyltransferase family protein [bacterium]|nr:nucleotidyltransferase family protein [bacterium]
MICSPEQLLLFFSSLADISDSVRSRADAVLRGAVDWNYLSCAAVNLDVSPGLLELLAGKEDTVDRRILERLVSSSARCAGETASMRELWCEVSSLLTKGGFDQIPLKGCDPRIAHGARRKSNPMVDVDILIRRADTEYVGEYLENNGYLYLGARSGSHMNFCTDETNPRFIEIHWDLVNRNNPLHRRLFSPLLDALWERSITMNGQRLLCGEDMISYLACHAVKEYFHNPKWLSDIAWIIENRLYLSDPGLMKFVTGEWGISKALGIIAEALDYHLRTTYLEQVLACGAVKPDMMGRYVAKRLLRYDRLRSLRPVIFFAVASPPFGMMRVLAGSVQRVVQKSFPR